MKQPNISSSIKNPLGVIALFVTFIDGIAGLVISVNFEHLHGACERLPLIWFIVLFPIIVLVAFLYLVIKHPEKLYGPNDFDDQELYLKALGKIIKPNEKPEKIENPEKFSLKGNPDSWCFFAYSTMNTSQLAISIQEAALQKYSDEHHLEIKTDVYSPRVKVFDGIAEKDGDIYLFDVKTNFSHVTSMKMKLEDISKGLLKNTGEHIHIVLILVTKDKIHSDKLNQLCEQFDGIQLNLEMVNYTNDDLCLKIE